MPPPSPERRRPARKPAARYHHGDLRRALIDEAARTIAHRGVDALTLREVGARLGVSRTALYRHFDDKDALIAAVAREGFERFRADLLAAWQRAEGTTRGLDLMGHAYVQFALAHPAHYRVMFGRFRPLGHKDPSLTEEGMGAFQVLVEALTALQRAGLVAPDDPRALAVHVWAGVHGIAMLAIDGQLGPDHVASPQVEHLLPLMLQRLHTGIDRASPSGRPKAP